MAGAVIIEGDFDDVPEIAAARERLLVLSEVVFDGFGMIEDFDTLFPEDAARFLTVNGQREPTIAMRPGEVQRWRILHAGYQDDIFLALQDHTLHPIARDGIALARMDQPKPAPEPMSADDPTAVLIAPGQRIDVLVQAGAPGTYELRALPYDQGYPAPPGRSRTLVVAGEPLPMKLPASLPPAPLAAIRDEEITGRRGSPSPRGAGGGRRALAGVQIPGRRAELRHDRVDQRVRLGAVEEWTIVNASPRRSHLPHPHQSVPADQGQRPAFGRAGMARHGVVPRERQPDVPLALPRFHGQVHAALPHDEP